MSFTPPTTNDEICGPLPIIIDTGFKYPSTAVKNPWTREAHRREWLVRLCVSSNLVISAMSSSSVMTLPPLNACCSLAERVCVCILKASAKASLTYVFGRVRGVDGVGSALYVCELIGLLGACRQDSNTCSGWKAVLPSRKEQGW